MSLACFGQDTTRYTFRFSSDGSTLSRVQVKVLDSLIQSLDGALNSCLYFIQGHTDNIGDRPYNIRLSEKRCKSVKKSLVKMGVSENKISFEEFAFDLPVATNETETGRADNRRTTLTIITNIPAPAWKIKPQVFDVNLKSETILTTKNGCKIIIPGGAFELPDLKLFDGKVEIEVIEYNNPAYFIASGIPMSYEASGKLFMYHSEEMLSIKAFHKSLPLELKDNVKITLNCRKVDSLYETGFYKFNLREKKWFEDNKVKPQGALGIGEKPAAQPPAESPAVGNKSESAGTKAEEKTGQPVEEKLQPPSEEFETNIKKIKKAKVDTGGYFASRSGGADWDLDTLGMNCHPSCCQARFYIRLGLKLSETPFDLTGLYFSKRYLASGNAAHNSVYAENLLSDKKYSPVKLVAKKLFLRRKAIISIKYDKEQNPELNALRGVKWVYRFKKNTEDYSSFQKRTFSDIRIDYNPITKVAAVKLKEEDHFCHIVLKPKDPDGNVAKKIMIYRQMLTQRVLPLYSCFWSFSKNYFARGEKELVFKNWIRYFNTHLSDVHSRYDSLNRNMEEVIKSLQCHCPVFKRDTFPPEEWDTVSVKKILLKRSGPNRMLIIGLGIYNYDRVVPIEDVIYIDNPLFRDRWGRKINPKESFLILGGLNGMIHLDSTQRFMLIDKYRNTLFIVDHANRRYKLVIEPRDDIRHHGNRFVMENVTSKTEDLEGLEKELLEKR